MKIEDDSYDKSSIMANSVRGESTQTFSYLRVVIRAGPVW